MELNSEVIITTAHDFGSYPLQTRPHSLPPISCEEGNEAVWCKDVFYPQCKDKVARHPLINLLGKIKKGIAE